MITLTPAAIEQIRASAEQADLQGLAMRIAAKRNPDGSLHYAMGFDDNLLEGDAHIDADGIEVIISEASQPLVKGMTVDYVEIEPDTFQFIFLNPNDANYSPPA
jgi:iron-sulfur cluster assembly accessory protein